jgi:acetylornithine deacetylase
MHRRLFESCTKSFSNPMNLIELTKSLMSIASVSGEENAVGIWLCDHLQSLGWTVELQAVSEEQNNVIAHLNDSPRVWLSTHMDTVPPFIPPTEDEEKIYGRGACDAKGIIAAQITAAERLRAEGIEDIGLLFLVERTPARGEVRVHDQRGADRSGPRHRV